MLEVKFTDKMKKDLKRIVKRGKDPEKLTEVLEGKVKTIYRVNVCEFL